MHNTKTGLRKRETNGLRYCWPETSVLISQEERDIITQDTGSGANCCNAQSCAFECRWEAPKLQLIHDTTRARFRDRGENGIEDEGLQQAPIRASIHYC